MGAITNMRPDLFHAVVMGVPFVDCLTTMLDPSIPLTVIEEEEWGAPSVCVGGWEGGGGEGGGVLVCLHTPCITHTMYYAHLLLLHTA